jgi:hypothetical protein
MGMRLTISIFAVMLFLASSCSTIKTGKSTSGVQKNTYSEDLASYRPEPFVAEEQPVDTLSQLTFTDSDSVDVTARLNTVLDSASIYARSTIKYIDGFTIQVYGGDDRAVAQDYRLNLIRNFPSSEPRMVFEQPNYKVRVGRYYTRLEAQNLFTEVKQVFPKAIVIPARIYIK